MGRQIFKVLFIGGMLLQLFMAFWYIIPPAPLNTWGFIDEEFYMLVYLLIGIVVMAIAFIRRLDMKWFVILCASITILSICWNLMQHSYYYYEIGKVRTALYYDKADRYPSKIYVNYIMMAYNVVVILLSLLNARRAARVQ